MTTLLLFALLALGGDSCVQPDYASVCPLDIDPNMVEGALLCPFPADPNLWTCEAGKYNRTAAYEDCEGDYPVEITAVDPNVTVTQDTQAKTWTIAADLPPGLHYLIVRAVDTPRWAQPAERLVTVVVEATEPDNEPPVLH
jgi:hypothetical protein